MEPLTQVIAAVLSGGADAATIAIGLLLLRMERRVMRLEFKVFGFHSSQPNNFENSQGAGHE